MTWELKRPPTGSARFYTRSPRSAGPNRSRLLSPQIPTSKNWKRGLRKEELPESPACAGWSSPGITITESRKRYDFNHYHGINKTVGKRRARLLDDRSDGEVWRFVRESSCR